MKIHNVQEADKFAQLTLERKGYELISKKIDFVFLKGAWLGTWIEFMIKDKDGNLEFLPFVYKRLPFLTYYRQFENEIGFGETINLQRIKKYLDSKMVKRIWFCYPQRAIFESGKNEWRDYVEEHNTIRMQEKFGEVTTSLPISLLKRIDKEWSNEEITTWIRDKTIPEIIKEKLRNLLGKIFCRKNEN